MSKAGIPQCAKKLAEEAVEVALEATSKKPRRRKIVGEIGDLLDRLNDLMFALHIPLSAVENEQERRARVTKLVKVLRFKRKPRRR